MPSRFESALAGLSAPNFFAGALGGGARQDIDQMIQRDRALAVTEAQAARAKEVHDRKMATEDAALIQSLGYGDPMGSALGAQAAAPARGQRGRAQPRGGAQAGNVLDQAEAQGFADALDAIARRQGSQVPGMEAGVARSLQQLRQQGGMRADPTTDRRVSRASELDAAIEALPSELQGQALRNVPAERLGLKPSRIVRPAALAAIRLLAGRNDAASRSLMNMVGIPEGTPIEDIEAAVHEAQDYNAKLANMLGKIGEDQSALDLAARAAIMKQSLIQLSPSYAENPELDDTVAYLASQPHEEAAEFLKWLGTQDFRKHEKDLKRSYMHYTGLKGKGGGGIPETERRLNGARNELRTLLGSKARLGVKGPKLGSGRMYTAAESAELETINADIVRLRGDINYYTRRRDMELGRVMPGTTGDGDGGTTGDGVVTQRPPPRDYPSIWRGGARSPISQDHQRNIYEAAKAAVGEGVASAEGFVALLEEQQKARGGSIRDDVVAVAEDAFRRSLDEEVPQGPPLDDPTEFAPRTHPETGINIPQESPNLFIRYPNRYSFPTMTFDRESALRSPRRLIDKVKAEGDKSIAKKRGLARWFSENLHRGPQFAKALAEVEGLIAEQEEVYRIAQLKRDVAKELTGGPLATEPRGARSATGGRVGTGVTEAVGPGSRPRQH